MPAIQVSILQKSFPYKEQGLQMNDLEKCNFLTFLKETSLFNTQKPLSYPYPLKPNLQFEYFQSQHLSRKRQSSFCNNQELLWHSPRLILDLQRPFFKSQTRLFWLLMPFFLHNDHRSSHNRYRSLHNRSVKSHNRHRSPHNRLGRPHNRQRSSHNRSGRLHNRSGRSHNRHRSLHNRSGRSHNDQGSSHNGFDKLNHRRSTRVFGTCDFGA